jgi:hypothetical protein
MHPDAFFELALWGERAMPVERFVSAHGAEAIRAADRALVDRRAQAPPQSLAEIAAEVHDARFRLGSAFEFCVQFSARVRADIDARHCAGCTRETHERCFALERILPPAPALADEIGLSPLCCSRLREYMRCAWCVRTQSPMGGESPNL